MGTDLDTLIEAVLAAKQGDKEFVLSTGHDGWLAGVGNSRNSAVQIGEIEADFEASGATRLEAVTKLLELVRKHDGVWPGRGNPRFAEPIYEEVSFGAAGTGKVITGFKP